MVARECLARHLPIHGRGTQAVRTALVHPLVQRLLQLWRAWLLAGAASVLAATFRRRRAKDVGVLTDQGSEAKAAPASAPAPKAPAGAKRWSALHSLVKRKRFAELLLTPVGGRGPFVGSPEIALLVVASSANAALMLYKAWLMREFVTGQNLRQWQAWLKALAKFPLATFASALLTQITKFTQARVSLLWRRAATRRLMEGYFAEMNYYRLLHHSSVRIEDPDVRICADVQSACDALTGVLITGLSGVMMSVFSSWALYRRRGLLAIFLPYFYSFGIVPLNYALTRPDWSIFSRAQKAYGAYQQALKRVQTYGEGITLLRGQGFERAALERQALSWACEERQSWAILAKFDWFQHFIVNPYMPGIWQTVASFGASYIALRATSPGRPVLNPLEPNQAVVYEYGANISDFWQVFYAVRGASAFMTALDNYKRCSASLLRIEQLQDAFVQLKLESEVASQAHVLDGDSIAFRDVSVVTPTGVKLVAGLTLEVKPGNNLVICGHNGAGKSSIFRCLGQLWPVATGTVACPHAGRAGLHGATYYLPQRPANIVGSLSDQLTYPQRVAGGLPEVEIRRWLSYVQIEYVVDTVLEYGSLQEETDWAARLSLGEQQRLGIARVLYQRPRFAILDECTSAVPKDVERWLFELCRVLGISCVTITHRPALQEYHHRMLRLTGTLAEDGQGWELSDLPSNLLPTRPLAVDAEEAHSRIAELSATARDQEAGCNSRMPSSSSRARASCRPTSENGDLATTSGESLVSEVMQRWPTAPRRIVAALQLHLTDWSLRVRFLWLLACMLIRPQVAWEVYRTIGGSVSLAMSNDRVGLLSELLLNVAYAAGLCFLDRHIELLGKNLKLNIWLNVSSSLHELALSGAAFHRMQGWRKSSVESPMQRIADAKLLLDDLKQQLSTTGSVLVQMIYFLPLLLRGGGALPAITLVGLYATHMLVRTKWMPNFKAITARHSELEDRFQVAQTRMRHVAEPVAFSGGGDMERQRLEDHFEHLCEQRFSSMRQEFMYNFLTEFFLVYDNLPIWFHRLLSFNFAFRNEPTGGPSPASAVQNYLYDRTISVSLVGVQFLTAFHQELAKIDARATRLLELQEALTRVPPQTALAESDNCHLVVKDLDLTTPAGAVLAEGLSFEVRPGEPLLITGPNGCGKTALVRVLAGLWPAPEGTFIAAPPGGVVTVPQSPYLAPGSLGDQICYPQRFVLSRDLDRASAALSAVGLRHLLDRAGEEEWDYRCAWEEVLSGGEQQRLALARVLVHRPAFALLDECTSMVAADAEERLYDIVSKDFGVTPVTFSQRLFLPQLHRSELRLGSVACGTKHSRHTGSTGWRLEEANSGCLPHPAA